MAKDDMTERITEVNHFFKWVYNIVLGLKDDETTTYTPVKIEWLLSSPKIIKKRVLQGIFESDDSVLYDGKITCAPFPNNDSIGNLLKDFGIKSHFVNDRKWKRLGIEGINQLKKTSGILFLPDIKTKRYQLLEKIIQSNKVKPPMKVPNKIRNIVNNNKSLKSYQILKILINKYNFYTSRTTIERIKKEGVTKHCKKRYDRKDCRNNEGSNQNP